MVRRGGHPVRPLQRPPLRRPRLLPSRCSPPGRHQGLHHSSCMGLEGLPDLKAAREVAKHLGTMHHEFHFTVQDGIDC
ncbi:hypothetical protein E2562_030133 [Oryza meyeriana var. granulata]|uniref:Asparagine synthetase domain-containing protein n=1 Tax=Oryza meyeriana var. granulata TaxID=110450 RepID=A0A6G1BP98_9ORYZ|nr:hypothetical protein E2562_030133 [Oryza meyeriana var. granulata]